MLAQDVRDVHLEDSWLLLVELLRLSPLPRLTTQKVFEGLDLVLI